MMVPLSILLISGMNFFFVGIKNNIYKKEWIRKFCLVINGLIIIFIQMDNLNQMKFKNIYKYILIFTVVTTLFEFFNFMVYFWKKNIKNKEK